MGPFCLSLVRRASYGYELRPGFNARRSKRANGTPGSVVPVRASPSAPPCAGRSATPWLWWLISPAAGLDVPGGQKSVRPGVPADAFPKLRDPPACLSAEELACVSRCKGRGLMRGAGGQVETSVVNGAKEMLQSAAGQERCSRCDEGVSSCVVVSPGVQERRLIDASCRPVEVEPGNAVPRLRIQSP